MVFLFPAIWGIGIVQGDYLRVLALVTSQGINTMQFQIGIEALDSLSGYVQMTNRSRMEMTQVTFQFFDRCTSRTDS